MALPDLTIDDVLGDVLSALGASNRLVLAAPPGAGKTTRVPLALLDHAPCGDGRIVMLEPRRIAARMAAERMASLLGERVGETVGLSTRIDRRTSKATRIEVVTDGLFTRRLLSDPGLGGISTVIFDEIHERSLSADLGLALALDAQGALREDLRLLLMSATLDTDAVTQRLECSVVESQGRAFPVVTRYLGRDRCPVHEQVARAVRKALAETGGSILVFLPGAADIRRTAEALDMGSTDVTVHALFGALSPAEQDAAVRPVPAGTRKVVLATDIAESALTIEGVSTVVDAGYARVPVYDPSGGAARLETVRASRASVDQRRGRAGRTGPGVCYRLWDEAETRGLAPAPVPDILSADLSGLVLALAEWGERDPGNLTWLDAPPAGRVAAARAALLALGALDGDGALTEKGRAMAVLPMEPRLAALVAGTEDGAQKALAARIAVLSSERGVGGTSVDLAERLARFETERSPRAKALQRQAERWANGQPGGDPGRLIASAWPDRIARARAGEPGVYLLASGQAARLDADTALAKSEWLAVADLVGAAKGARITLAAALAETDALAAGVETVETASFDVATQSLRARRVKQLGAIILSEVPMKRPSGEAARAAILDAIAEYGFAAIRAEDQVGGLVARVGFLHSVFGEPWPQWEAGHLEHAAPHWLGPIITAAPPSPAQVCDALIATLDWPLPQDLAKLAPSTLLLPSGRAAGVDYGSEQGPLVEARVQELYGADVHPGVAEGRVPVTLSLLSPAGRPVATTRDVIAFWSGGYIDMAKDMRGRYPKHDWPDDPSTAKAHEGRTKARL
ncbi:MAG: ATP-dependent helicase HrpB [Pseudomonadota bacterium]